MPFASPPLLQKIVAKHEDVYGADKFIKTVQFSAGLAAVGLDALTSAHAAHERARSSPAGRRSRARDGAKFAVAARAARALRGAAARLVASLPEHFSAGLRQLAGQLA